MPIFVEIFKPYFPCYHNHKIDKRILPGSAVHIHSFSTNQLGSEQSLLELSVVVQSFLQDPDSVMSNTFNSFEHLAHLVNWLQSKFYEQKTFESVDL